MMPILILTGVITPGQLGPTSTVFLPRIRWRVAIMSRTGTSVMQYDQVELGSPLHRWRRRHRGGT